MKSVQTFSRVLYTICKGAGFSFLIIAIYTAFVLLTANEGASSLLVHVAGNHSTISYPFTNVPFLNVYQDGRELFLLFATLICYGGFALLLADVFLIFKQDKLFTTRSVKILTRFYLVNFIVPLTFLLFTLLSGDNPEYFFVLVLLHGIIGAFSWLMSKIFLEGLTLQEEQDFTL